MPSAATAKTDHKASSEVNPDATPIRQVIVLIEHKIRNLEKRKSKLDSYRDVQKSGKDLTADQLVAVSKYDEVLQLLDFAREFVKQIHSITTVSEKEQKKIARRELAQRTQQDIGKIREALLIQNILDQLVDDTVRNDFLNGINGAVKIEREDMDILEKFYVDVTPRRIEGSEYGTFSTAAHKSAEHMFLTIDSRPKNYYGEITYEKVRSILQSIIACEYFEKKVVEVPVEINGEAENETAPEVLIEKDGEIIDEISKDMNEIDITSGQQTEISIEKNIQNIELEAPAPASVPTPVFPTVMPTSGNQIQTITPQTAQVPIQAIVPTTVVAGAVLPVPTANTVAVAATPISAVPPNQIPHLGPTVRAVEQGYFKQHQYIQQMRPIAEVLGAGSFFFLQDSELDSPDPFPNVGVNFQNIQPQPQPPQLINATGIIQQNTVSNQNTQQQIQPASPQGGNNPTKSQIPTQTFTNQNFKTIVPQPTIYSTIKTDLSSAHIPGFATSSASLPVAIAPTATIIPTVPQVANVQQNTVHIIAPAPTAVPIPGFVSPQQFQTPSNNPSNNPPIVQQQQQISKPSVDVVTNVTHTQTDISSNIKDQMPPIENWNANDINQKTNSSTVNNSDMNDDNDSKEWNDNHHVQHHQHQNDNSNTWNDSNHQESNYVSSNRGYHQRRGGTGGGPSRNPSGAASNYYRGRTNNTFQSNSTGGGGNGSGGSGSGRTSTGNNGNNTFFRNNDNNYYSTMANGGNFNNGYNNSNSSYKPRGGGGNVNPNSMRGNGQGGGQHIRNNPPNASNHTNTTERTQQRPSSNNMSSRNNGPSGGGSGGNMRPPRGNATGGYRNSGNSSRPSQGVNV